MSLKKITIIIHMLVVVVIVVEVVVVGLYVVVETNTCRSNCMALQLVVFLGAA